MVIDNTVVIVEWQVMQGDDWFYPFIKTNDPVTMEDWTWVAQIRESQSRTATLVAEMDIDDASASTGSVTFSVASATTETIPAGTYWYEVQRLYAGALKTMVGGPLIVEGDTAVVEVP